MTNETDDIRYWLGLSLVEGIGPQTFKRLHNYFGSVRSVWEAPGSRFRKLGLSERVCDSLIATREVTDLDSELARLKGLGIRLLRWEDDEYPPNLKNTTNPPFLLYVKGRLPLHNELSLAVVGTRKFTSYGKHATVEIVRELAASGFTIISGLALGIDSIAHQVALSVSGKTVAVLGCGLDRIYPPANEGLAREIVNNGALISEFPLGFPPARGNFPSRNRIISGMSCGVLVCEAPEKSGALITASCAAEQGRPVFAVPGSIFSYNSRGVGRLIQDGAKLVLDAADILSELQLESQKRSVVSKNVVFKTKREKKIFDFLEDGPLHVDQIVRASKLSVSEVLSTLTVLAMRGMVEEASGGKWMRR